MKGFHDWHFSHLHNPVHKIEVKRKHYRLALVISAAGIWLVHEYSPHHEMHMVFLTNLLFAYDPTV